MPASNAVKDARKDTQSRETKAYRISSNVIRSISGNEGEGSNDAANVTEPNLILVSAWQDSGLRPAMSICLPAKRYPLLDYDGLPNSY